MSTMHPRKYEPDYAVPPGETIAETIEELGMPQSELAVRLGMSPKAVNLIIHGKAPISHDTAMRLERVTRVSAAFWTKREAIYQERLARLRDAKRLEANRDPPKQTGDASIRREDRH